MRTATTHYIAPSAISITPNANGSANDLAVKVAGGTKIKVYYPPIYYLGTEDAAYQQWTLKGRNRRLADSSKPYTIYARLKKVTDYSDEGNVAEAHADGYIVFAEQVKDSEDNWTDPYILTPNTSSSGGKSSTGADGKTYTWGPIPAKQADRNRSDYWWVKIGTVSEVKDGGRTVDLDTGILGTDEYNQNWVLNPDALPLRVEITNTQNSDMPWVLWGETIGLKARLIEGWSKPSDYSVDHWTITRDTRNAEADEAWNNPVDPTPEEAQRRYNFAYLGEIILSHIFGGLDDFNAAYSATFHITAWGRKSEDTPTPEPEPEPNEEEELNGSRDGDFSEDEEQQDTPSGDEGGGEGGGDEGGGDSDIVAIATGNITIRAMVMAEYTLGLSTYVVSYSSSSDEYVPEDGVEVRILTRAQDGQVSYATVEHIAAAGIAAYRCPAGMPVSELFPDDDDEEEEGGGDNAGGDSGDDGGDEGDDYGWSTPLVFTEGEQGEGVAVIPITDFHYHQSLDVNLINTARMVIHKTSIAFVRDGVMGQSSFKSIMFCRMTNTPNPPTTGDFAHPSPADPAGTDADGTAVTWSDGIPAGDKQLWATSRVFTSDGQSPQEPAWSTPRKMSDSETFDVEFAYKQGINDLAPAAPVDGENGNRHGCIPASNQIWFDPDLDKYDGTDPDTGEPKPRDWTDCYWRAEREILNGVPGEWVIQRIKGERGDQGLNGSYQAQIYRWHNSGDTAPELRDPSASLPQDWSQTVPPQPTGYNYLWMSVCTVNGDGTHTNWSAPIRISGQDGNAGADGSDMEYIFILKQEATTFVSDPNATNPKPSVITTGTVIDPTTGQRVEITNPEQRNQPDFVPTNWTDNPVAISATWKYGYMSWRKKPAGSETWGAFSDPVVWSHWGRNGIDGDGVEYVFVRTNISTAPTITASTEEGGGNEPYGGKTYLDDDFLPLSSAGRCTDDPVGTQDNMKYEWVAKRTKGAPDGEGQRTWNMYSGTMALWSMYAEGITKSEEKKAFQVSDSGNTPPTGTWYQEGDEDPTTHNIYTEATARQKAIDVWNAAHGIQGSDWAVNTFMWTRTNITWSDDSHTMLYASERNPDDGLSGQSIVVDHTDMLYSCKDSNTVDPTTINDWASYSQVTKTPGWWLWSKAITYFIKTGDGSSAGTAINYNATYIPTNGTNGRSVEFDANRSYIRYAISEYGVAPADQDYPHDIDENNPWSPTMPQAVQGKYLWTMDVTVYKYSDDGTVAGSTTTYGVTYFPEDGARIDPARTKTYYATSQTYVAPTHNSLNYSETFPVTLNKGDYLYVKSVVAYVDDSNLYTSYSVSMLGTDGDDGDPGTDGFTTHFGYARLQDGQTLPDSITQNNYYIYFGNSFKTTNFNGANVIGTYRSQDSTDSPYPWDYKWTYWRGEKGTDGDQWTIGSDGFWYLNGVIYEDPTTHEHIKAEGKDGTGVEIKGGVDVLFTNDKTSASQTSLQELVMTSANIGDCYTVTANKHLYFYDGTTAAVQPDPTQGILGNPFGWRDLGKFSGDDGQSSYMHIAYADAVTLDAQGNPTSCTGFTVTKQKESYPWVGLCTNDSQPDPDNFKAYEWNKVKGADGESPWVADLDNSMDSVSCDDTGYVVAAATVSTAIDLRHGSTAESFSVTVLRNGTSISLNTETEGVTVTYNGYNKTLSVAYSTTARITGKDDFTLNVSNPSGISRQLHFIVKGVIGDVYNLKPSVDEIHAVRNDNGDYLVNNSNIYDLRCGYTKNVNGTITTVNDVTAPASGAYAVDGRYNVYFHRHTRGGNWESTYYLYTNATYKEYLTSLNLNTYDAVEFVFAPKRGNTTSSFTNEIDRETVYVIADGLKGANGQPGQNGEPGRGMTSISEHYKASPNATGETKPIADGQENASLEWTTDPNVPNAQGVSQWNETNKYLWNYEKVSYSSVPTPTRTDPRVIAIWTKDGANGTNGKGVDSITNYYKVSTLDGRDAAHSETRPSTDPTGSTGQSGWYAVPQAPNEEAPYLWNYEKIAYTDGTSSYTDPHVTGHFGKDGSGQDMRENIVDHSEPEAMCNVDGWDYQSGYRRVFIKLDKTIPRTKLPENGTLCSAQLKIEVRNFSLSSGKPALNIGVYFDSIQNNSINFLTGNAEDYSVTQNGTYYVKREGFAFTRQSGSTWLENIELWARIRHLYSSYSDDIGYGYVKISLVKLEIGEKCSAWCLSENDKKGPKGDKGDQGDPGTPGQPGNPGADAVIVTASPSSLIINQSLDQYTDNLANLSENIYFSAKRNGNNVSFSISSNETYVEGSRANITISTDHIIITRINQSGGNYYDSGVIVCKVYWTDGNDSGSQTLYVRFYVNLLKTWAVTTTDQCTTAVGQMIGYDLSDGETVQTKVNADINASAEGLRTEFSEEITNVGGVSPNLFGFHKGIVWKDNNNHFFNGVYPFVQGYGIVVKDKTEYDYERNPAVNCRWGRVQGLGTNGQKGPYVVTFQAKVSEGTNLLRVDIVDKNPEKGIGSVPSDSYWMAINSSSWTSYEVYFKINEGDDPNGYLRPDGNGQYNGFVDFKLYNTAANIFIRHLKVEHSSIAAGFVQADEDLAYVGSKLFDFQLTNNGDKMLYHGSMDNIKDVYETRNITNWSELGSTFDFLYAQNIGTLEKNKVYTLSFWAKSSTAGFVMTCHLYNTDTNSHPLVEADISDIYTPDGYGVIREGIKPDGRTDIVLSTAWKQYCVHFYTTLDVPTVLNVIPLRVIKERNQNGSRTGKIYIGDIMLHEGYELPDSSYRSIIEQDARRISLAQYTGAKKAGIDIARGTVDIYGDRVTFSSADGQYKGKVRIDPANGTLYAEDGYFKGEVNATSGNIGGFSIGSDVLQNTDWGNYIKLMGDSKLVQIGKGTAGPMPDDNAVLYASNFKGNSAINTALYLNAQNATYNYAFYGNGNGVLNGYMQGFKIRDHYIRNSSTSTIPNPTASGTTLKLSEGMVQAIAYVDRNISGPFLYLPTLGEIKDVLGINDSTTNFCAELIILNQSEISGEDDSKSVWIRGDSHNYDAEITSSSARPRILRGSGVVDVELPERYCLHFFITYIKRRFIANYILG